MERTDVGLFGPESITWRIHADPSMLVGGLRALLIQALHPLAMAGVEHHSDYRADPWGRLRRTTEYVLTVTFGTTAEAEAVGAVVRRVHEDVRGVDGVTDKPYYAGDPELLAWVHNVLVHSFLTAYRRYGGSVSHEDADLDVSEMVRIAPLVGLERDAVPATLADLRDYLRSVEGLQVTPAARQSMRLILAPPMPLPLRPLWAVPGAAAVGLVPARFRRMYGLPHFVPADAAVRMGALALFRSARLVVPDPPPIRDAWARARRAAA
jgi:uncharacterized protein (DUF2236 family)